MNRSRLLPLSLLIAFTLGVVACSSSDSPTDPGTTADTTAPQVSGTDPRDGETSIAADAVISVMFNEAMDTATGAGQVTLSSGGTAVVTWDDDRTMSIAHGAWAEGAHVTVTIGTGVTDAAGNGLAAAYVFDFYVASSTLTVLETVPVDGASGVNRSANPAILFSDGVDPATVLAHATVSSIATKVVYPFTVTTNGSWVTLVMEADLPPSTYLVVDLGTGIESWSGTPLESAYSFDFTTGTDVDTTPPTVLSSSPANGTTFAADIGAFQVTFSEPMDPDSFDPASMNAEFGLLIMATNVTPQWSADFTHVTVALPSPLPAGLPVQLVFDGLADANGNVQPTPWTFSGQVAGTADYYPTADGTRYVYEVEYSYGDIGNPTPTGSGGYNDYLQVDDQGGGLFRLADYDDDSFLTPSGGYELYRRTSGAIEWVGFAEDDGGTIQEITFDSPVTVLPLPLAAGTWTDATTVTIPGQGTLSATLNGTVSGPSDYYPSGPEIYFKDAFRVILELDVQAGGTPVIAERDTIWYAATLGPVQRVEYNEELDVDEWYREAAYLRFPGK